MRWLIWVILGVATLWGGLWFAASSMVERGVQDWFKGQGPAASATRIEVAGFPSRIDLTLTEPRFGDPAAGGPVWQAPFLQVLTIGYQPWRMIAAFPPEQSLTLPDGSTVELTADKLQASLALRPVTSLPLDRIVVEGHGLALRAGAGPGVLAQKLIFATRPDPTRQNVHDIGLTLTAVQPEPGLLDAAPGAGLPDGAADVLVDVFLGFSAPIDRFAGKTHPALTLVELHKAHFGWGDILLEAEGSLAPDAAGFAEGRIDIRLSGWDSAISVAVAAGALRHEIAPTWSEFARRLAATSRSPGRIDLALTMTGGRMRLGPLPLGPAPRFAPSLAPSRAP